MKSLFRYLLLLPIGAIIVFFAIGNRHFVKLVPDPSGFLFPGLEVQAPVYLVVLVSIITGILIGGFTAWLKQGKHRKAARTARADARKLESEADRLRNQVSSLPAAEAHITAAYTGRNAA